MHLRTAVVSDLVSIEALLRASGLPTAGVTEHLTHFIVASDAGNVVTCGGLEYQGNFALIRSIAVASNAQGNGLGKTIVSQLLTESRARSVPSVVLLTTTAADYFASLGFATVARQDVPAPLLTSSQFQGVCPDSATAMLMNL
ncbi:MAG: GNAT family N-acetyltransferase [Burkholderia sp.]|jgi:amino-acid N-acetyltransferase|uniref:arsenic resistance N-acetyltransferase ArsN2 n=1 Tax=Burkholderia sp. TaxID=36773 RepID=UPI00258EEC27|nr:arsenic resistance N-acetyltransferase ArsN2 [Burkholderia sp.]MCA3641258.1 GNAT family N-acetyltransferase [Methylobacterium sp.]MCA3781511.1 GNAT family N-acetyltransferase [Burkholderia sp.]MCA3784067.1 GNAT family N-acetyltransferase [Burkholderia sp.]MCA3796154.1 GNAT family N-acetyltransferase [Burkholderia sp.]MCA3802345.1 GNAT family N-acetyltransferase [Burkholderia sp.]